MDPEKLINTSIEIYYKYNPQNSEILKHNKEEYWFSILPRFKWDLICLSHFYDVNRGMSALLLAQVSECFQGVIQK